MALTPKQARFVDEYLIDLNATQAAIRAGYSPRGADVRGAELLGNRSVRDAVTAAQAARSERTRITADRVLEELAVIGLSSVWHYTVGDDGRVDLSADAPLASIRAVSAIKHKVRSDEDGSVTHEVELKLWDKNTALANIGKHLGMFVERVKVDATVTQAPGRLDDTERARVLRALLATREN